MNELSERPVGVIVGLTAALDYEINSSWWAQWIGWDWGQALAGSYFAWKVKSKHRRYLAAKARKAMLMLLRPNAISSGGDSRPLELPVGPAGKGN